MDNWGSNNLMDMDSLINKFSLMKIDSTPPKANHNGNGKRTRCRDQSPASVKRACKCIDFQEFDNSIESASHRSTTSEILTGDFSKTLALPLAIGKHEDLHSISGETLSKLIRGDFRDIVREFQIIDCRSPYTFLMGHIDGAINLYTHKMIEKGMLRRLRDAPTIQPDTHNNKRSIVVFHCEYSLERGPELARFLRSLDRQSNQEHYPALHYPEIYLLHGGYQTFFEEFGSLYTQGLLSKRA